MRRFRVSALLATLVATVALTIGTALAGAQPAAATPRHYPPPPPRLTSNKGVVKYGVAVRVRGHQYQQRERVIVTVRLKARGSNSFRTVSRYSTSADRRGDFTSYVRMARPGTVIIEATGSRSRGSASVLVFVIDKRKGHGGWTLRRVASTENTGATVAQAGATTASPARQPASDTAAVAVAALAAMSLAGSVLITRRIVRRRRKAPVAG
jgi:hypothetical protein